MSVGFSTGPIIGDVSRPLGVPSTAGEAAEWMPWSVPLARAGAKIEAETGGDLAGAFGALSGGTGGAVPVAAPEPAVAPEALNQEFGIKGALSFDSPLPLSVAQSMYDAKRDELARQDAAARRPGGFAAGVANLGMGLASTALDPLGAASMLIPGVAPARWAIAAESGSLGARVAARAGIGALSGATAMAPLAALKYGLSTQDQADYSATDALLDIAYGGVLGAGLHPIAGAAGDLFGRYFPKEAGAGELPPGYDWHAHMNTLADLETREAALRTALAQQIDGSPVEVRPIFDPAHPSAETALAAARGEPLPEDRALDATATEAAAAPAPEAAPALEPFDLRGAARTVDPETVGQFEQLEQNREAVRQQIATGSEPAPGDIDRQAQVAQQKISDLERQLAGFTQAGNRAKAELTQGRLERAQAQLADAQAAREAAVTGPLRQKLQTLDEQMRDLAPKYSGAMDAARARRDAVPKALASVAPSEPGSPTTSPVSTEPQDGAPPAPKGTRPSAPAGVSSPPAVARAAEGEAAGALAPGDKVAEAAAPPHPDPEVRAADERVGRADAIARTLEAAANCMGGR